MEKILHQGKVVALKISAIPPGTTPVTAPEEALQVLTLKYPKGRLVAAHRHEPHRRETEVLQECLVVISGKLRISFFDDEGHALAHVELVAGEACITLSGPHSVEFLEDSEVIELKNGPFFDDKKPL
jgi:cupin fold WbuC family metalloprotein